MYNEVKKGRRHFQIKVNGLCFVVGKYYHDNDLLLSFFMDRF